MELLMELLMNIEGRKATTVAKGTPSARPVPNGDTACLGVHNHSVQPL